jgi:small-conductance mechanosensitive channel
MTTTRFAKIIIVLWIIGPFYFYVGDHVQAPSVWSDPSVASWGIIKLIIGIIAYRSINKLRRQLERTPEERARAEAQRIEDAFWQKVLGIICLVTIGAGLLWWLAVSTGQFAS